MIFSPASKTYIYGAGLLFGLTLCAWRSADRGGPYFMTAFAIAAIAYLLGLRELWAAAQIGRRALVIGLVLAAVWHAEFLRLPPGNDDDVHRYVWDGRLQRFGYNPYLVPPNEPAVAQLHTDETRGVNNPDLPSPYPPGAQIFFRGVTALRESTFALRVAFVLCEMAIVFLLLDLLRTTQRPEHLVLAFAWNPLLAIEVAGSGHIDIVMALGLAASAVALARRWRTLAAVTLGLAIAVKLLPIVLLPLYWKRVRVRDAVCAAIVTGCLTLPFLDHGRLPLGSLGTYVQNFRFNGPIFAVLAPFASPRLLTAWAVMAGLITAGWIRRRSPAVSPEAFAWPTAVTLLFAPVVFPWYLLALLPFLISASTWLIALWSVAIGLTYVQWHLRALGEPWGALPAWIMVVEYGLLAIAAAFMAVRRIGNPVSERSKASSMPTAVPFTEEEHS